MAVATAQGRPTARTGPRPRPLRRRATTPRPRGRRGPQPVGDGPQREDEGQRPEGRVETADRVERVEAGPAQGRGADEVDPEVVPDGEAGDSGDLGRVAEGELPREAHVKGGVVGDEGIEEEVALGAAVVPGARG